MTEQDEQKKVDDFFTKNRARIDQEALLLSLEERLIAKKERFNNIKHADMIYRIVKDEIKEIETQIRKLKTLIK